MRGGGANYNRSGYAPLALSASATVWKEPNTSTRSSAPASALAASNASATVASTALRPGAQDRIEPFSKRRAGQAALPGVPDAGQIPLADEPVELGDDALDILVPERAEDRIAWASDCP